MNSIPLNILTFPVWWYTTGVTICLQWCLKKYRYQLHSTGLLAFIRHWKEPLFGDYSSSGIIVSFFLRIILILGKTIFLGFKILMLLLFFLGYLLLLPAILLLIFYQLFSL